MTAFQIALKASNPRTLWFGVATVFGGMAAAATHSNVEFLLAVLCLVFVIFGQIACNLIYRYYDDIKYYGENRDDGLPDYDEAGNSLKFILTEAIRTFSILAMTAGLAIFSISGWWTLIVAALLVSVIMICNVGKHPLRRTPYYIIATFFVFGPIGVISTELVQSQQSTETILNWWDLQPAIYTSIVLGFMAVNCHAAHGLRQMAYDRRNGRKSLALLLGKRGTLISMVIYTLIYGFIGFYGPYASDIDRWYIYMPIPVVTMSISFWQIAKLAKGEYNGTANWLLFDMVFSAIVSFVILMFIGTPS